MSEPFRVGEIAELCNLPPEAARYDGYEVVIVELAQHRTWCGEYGEKLSGLAYVILFDDRLVACRPKNLRKRHKPIDTVDTEAPNKKTRWADGPWKPRSLEHV